MNEIFIGLTTRHITLYIVQYFEKFFKGFFTIFIKNFQKQNRAPRSAVLYTNFLLEADKLSCFLLPAKRGGEKEFYTFSIEKQYYYIVLRSLP